MFFFLCQKEKQNNLFPWLPALWSLVGASIPSLTTTNVSYPVYDMETQNGGVDESVQR